MEPGIFSFGTFDFNFELLWSQRGGILPFPLIYFGDLINVLGLFGAGGSFVAEIVARFVRFYCVF